MLVIHVAGTVRSKVLKLCLTGECRSDTRRNKVLQFHFWHGVLDIQNIVEPYCDTLYYIKSHARETANK